MESNTKQKQLRSLPAVHKLIEIDDVKRVQQQLEAPHDIVVSAAQDLLSTWRDGILSGSMTDLPETEEALEQRLVHELVTKLEAQFSPNLRRVINGTGVVLHTNLGRALLSEEAVRQVEAAAGHYSNLEYDIAKGQRGSRHSHVESLICDLTGAEAAMVVNNNAAAVYLVLREMAQHQEVIVSRGQLVEIGGSFRVSEIMAESGARLVEVGTTNKTHAFDYERAITDETALFMKVHSSNFRTVGFTHALTTSELVTLAERHDIPVFEDLGSGVLLDLKPDGIGDEPTVQETIEAGADLVSFSGDKLLGGPQAGMIAGKKKWIDRLKKNQLARVLRVDKMTLAGLDATLRSYLNPEKAKAEIPTLRDIHTSLEEIEEKARAFMTQTGMEGEIHMALVDDESAVGGGTLPGVTLPTKAVALSVSGKAVHRMEKRLREMSPPVVVKIVDDQLRIDFRTIRWNEIDLLVEKIHELTS